MNIKNNKLSNIYDNISLAQSKYAIAYLQVYLSEKVSAVDTFR
jgi:hypothetical protein